MMEGMKDRLINVFLSKDMSYSSEAKLLIGMYDEMLRKTSSTEEEYMKLEEQLNAVLAQYEEEAFWCGFKSGIHFLLSVIAD